jgi:hypothetical protein
MVTGQQRDNRVNPVRAAVDSEDRAIGIAIVVVRRLIAVIADVIGIDDIVVIVGWPAVADVERSAEERQEGPISSVVGSTR